MSRATALLDLAPQLARHHERSLANTITVVPVLVDDLDAALPSIEALAAVLDAPLFVAGAPAGQRRTPPSADAARIATVEQALDGTRFGGRGKVARVDSQGANSWEFVDPPAGGELSPGEQTVIDVCCAVTSRELDEAESQAAIVAYRVSQVDLDFRSAIWELFTLYLMNLPSQTLRTLFVIVESEIDVTAHCQPKAGFRLAVEGEHLLSRHGPDELPAVAARISKENQAVVVFLAAGFSASSGFPLGNRMRDSAIARLLGLHASRHGSSELARRYYEWAGAKDGWLTPREMSLDAEDFIQQLTLEQVIRAEERHFSGSLPTLEDFKDLHDQLVPNAGPAVRSLCRYLDERVGRVVLVTVNFDTLIESHAAVPLRVFADDAEFEGAADYVTQYLAGQVSAVPYLKVHGTIDRPESCVVSAEQTDTGVGNGKLAALRTLLDAGNQRLWIYVGSSMRDQDLLRVLGSEDFARGLDERWVVPHLTEDIRRFGEARDAFWTGSGHPTMEDRLVTETADAFFAALAASL